MSQPIRLGIVHQNRLLQECLDSVLSATEQFTVLGTDDPQEPRAVAKLVGRKPEVVLVDLGLSKLRAAEICRELRQGLPQVKLLLLVSADSAMEAMECVEAGANGCVLAEASLEELTTAIHRVYAGESFCSPEIAQSVFAEFSRLGNRGRWRERADSVQLTTRELTILQLVAERLSNKLIAKRLSLSLYTVKNHVHNILEKLQAEDRFEAVEYARQRGWLEDL